MKVGDLTFASFYRRIRETIAEFLAGGDVVTSGPHADDAAATAAGVPYLGLYYQADGAVHVNLDGAPALISYFRPDGTSLFHRPDGTSLYLRP